VKTYASDFCNPSSRLLREVGTQEPDGDDGGDDVKRAEAIFSANLSARLTVPRGDGMLGPRLRVFVARSRNFNG
jgi:hypothetical protein